jgi:hypothetical protein
VRNAHGAAGFGHSLHVFACKPFRNGLQNDDELAHLAQHQASLRWFKGYRQPPVIRPLRGSGDDELVAHCGNCDY